MNSFVAAHATRRGTLHLHAPPAHVFPLFTPEGEREWVPGWSPRYAWPPDGSVRIGTTFFTEHAGRATTWMVASHEPGVRVVYTRVTAGLNAVRVEVSCAPEGEGSAVTVRYDYVGLTPAGNESIEQVTQPRFAEWMREWEQSINTVLAAGSPADQERGFTQSQQS
ncbi:MAG TPA: SRPBCC family protein [Longimicrobium sp.]|nr:SRPBCC family protein [Longimicrobium sp.]